MAISRHDPEWKRTIGIAMFAGVTFKQVGVPIPNPKNGTMRAVVWWATLPNGGNVEGTSKIDAARRALLALEGKL